MGSSWYWDESGNGEGDAGSPVAAYSPKAPRKREEGVVELPRAPRDGPSFVPVGGPQSVYTNREGPVVKMTRKQRASQERQRFERNMWDLSAAWVEDPGFVGQLMLIFGLTLLLGWVWYKLVTGGF